MNNLLIFFALPIAVIIISVALQKILKCPILVSAIIFAIFLIVTFIINNLEFLVAAIVYAIISFITAYLTYIICRILNSQSENCRRNNNNNNNDNNTNDTQIINNLIDALNNSNNTQDSCGCGCNNNNNQVSGVNGISARINVVPNNNTNGRTGSINGCYRSRQ